MGSATLAGVLSLVLLTLRQDARVWDFGKVGLSTMLPPDVRASVDPRLRRPVTPSEYREAVALARSTGLHRFADG